MMFSTDSDSSPASLNEQVRSEPESVADEKLLMKWAFPANAAGTARTAASPTTASRKNRLRRTSRYLLWQMPLGIATAEQKFAECPRIGLDGQPAASTVRVRHLLSSGCA